jgi:outer membrane protein TolC
LFLFCFSSFGEVRTMSLRQALEVALNQNPDLILARLDQARAREQVTIVRDPFNLKVFGGSGAAYTNGFPTSIDGNAPSIFTARSQMALFNRPLSYQAAQANQAVRGAEIDVGAKQDEVVYRVAALFLDGERASRELTSAERQVESLARVRNLVEVRVSEGRELPIETRKAGVTLLRARQSVEQLTMDLINAETALAQVLGLGPDDRVRAAAEERGPLDLPTEERAIEDALENSRELKRLESNLQMKILEVKQHQAARLPRVNLVAQYNLLARYNNYEQFFNRFQYNNYQFGASFEIPLLVGRAPEAARSQAEIDAAKIRLEVSRTRTRIATDVRRAHQEIRRAETARDLARADLDLAREQLTIDLAQFDEGRVDRAAEQEKWMAYYAAQHTLERARLDVLRQSGTLLAALR